MAGMYEEGEGDVPRIVSVPAWTAIDIANGDRWLDAKAVGDTSVSAYRQVLDMRTGTARTSYHWTVGSQRMSVRVETFISRADPSLSVVRLTLAPQYRGRLRVRFALVGWPPPRRLALATLEKAERDWKPADIWYPGHMAVRSRAASPGTGRSPPLADFQSGGAPDHHPGSSRGHNLGQGAARPYRADHSRGRHRPSRDRLRRLPGTQLHLYSGCQHRFVNRRPTAASPRHSPGTNRPGPRVRSSGGEQCPRLAAAVADRHRDHGRPTAAAGSALHAVLSPVQRRLGYPAGHSADGPLERRLLRAHLLGFRHLDVPIAAGHPSGCGALAGVIPGSHPGGGAGQRAAERLPGRDVSLGGRRAGPGNHSPLRGAECPVRDSRHW